MYDNVMIFCSNPVNGGTATVMAQTVLGLMSYTKFKIIPCTNAGNDVEIYKTLPNISYLNVKSEKQSLGELFENVGIFARITRRILRNIKYRKIIKQNIMVFRAFLLENKIDTVLIHNGGYVGDDLCNQLLHASSGVVMKHRIMVLHSDFCKTKVGMIRFASSWGVSL